MVKNKSRIPLSLTTFLVAVALTGCAAKQSDLHSSQEREMTLGSAQRNISVGMSQADVATALGSPNIVTKDSDGNEAWVYDKIATEVSQSSSSNAFTVILFSAGKNKSYSASTQKTLTIVIKFDENSNVKTMSYHSSKF